MSVFREALKAVGVDPIFSVALDRKVEMQHKSIREKLIPRFKEHYVFDKCVMDELSRLQIVEAIRAVAVKEASNEAIAILLPRYAIPQASARIRDQSKRSSIVWGCTPLASRQLVAALYDAMKSSTPAHVVSWQRVYASLGLKVVNHTCSSCLGCFLPTNARQNVSISTAPSKMAHGWLKSTSAGPSSARPFPRNLVSYAFDTKSSVQLCRCTDQNPSMRRRCFITDPLTRYQAYALNFLDLQTI